MMIIIITSTQDQTIHSEIVKKLIEPSTINRFKFGDEWW